MKIAIFDETYLIGFAIKTIIKQRSDIQEVNFFTDFDNLKDFLSKKQVDFLFLDIKLERDDKKRDGLELIRYLHREYPKMKLIVVSQLERPEIIFTAIKYGASSYILKYEANENIILTTIDKLSKNEDYFSETVSNIILKNFVSNLKQGEEISEKKPRNLTRREIQILKLICEGLTNRQIAEGLFISVRTVDAHKNHIMQKLGLKTTADLIKYAIKHGYVELD